MSSSPLLTAERPQFLWTTSLRSSSVSLPPPPKRTALLKKARHGSVSRSCRGHSSQVSPSGDFPLPLTVPSATIRGDETIPQGSASLGMAPHVLHLAQRASHRSRGPEAHTRAHD